MHVLLTSKGEELALLVAVVVTSVREELKIFLVMVVVAATMEELEILCVVGRFLVSLTPH